MVCFVIETAGEKECVHKKKIQWCGPKEMAVGAGGQYDVEWGEWGRGWAVRETFNLESRSRQQVFDGLRWRVPLQQVCPSKKADETEDTCW